MRPIDADALKEYILRSVPNWSEDREIMLDCLSNSPTIEERKKGKWLKAYGDHEAFGVRPFYRYCSECNESTVWAYNFCPHCGADMRGEQE